MILPRRMEDGLVRRTHQAVLDYGLSAVTLKEIAASSGILRSCYEVWSVLAAASLRRAGRNYEEAMQVCGAVRMMEGLPMLPALSRAHSRILDAAGAGPSVCRCLAENKLLASFLRTDRARRAAWWYRQHGDDYACSMKFRRPNKDATPPGNLVALKAFDERTGEKGVLYLQYTESIESFVAMFDLSRIAQRYTLVLEPSWWGYQDACFLLLAGKELDVVVLAQDKPDFDYISSLSSNLQPIDLGAGDWVDPDEFTPGECDAKRFDFVMVASWNPVKRHGLFFRSLAAARLQSSRVALVGYPTAGHTQADIERMAAGAGLTGVTVFEAVSRSIVAEVVRSSHVGVMLTRREGANRGIYECLFSDVPVIVSAANRGVNKVHINSETGRLASDEELPRALGEMLEAGKQMSPRAWMVRNSGCKNAWHALNDFLAESASKKGKPYSRPVAHIKSMPNIGYMVHDEATAFRGVYGDLRKSFREPSG